MEELIKVVVEVVDSTEDPLVIVVELVVLEW
jgi:hypothetical protein